MKKKVLIVENDLDIQSIVSYLLELEGYEVAAIAPCSADELVRHQADLILLDEWINKMEGHMLCTQIKKVHTMQHIPVVIFSTAVNLEEIAKNCQADGFVHKPFDLQVLIDEVKRCCQN